MEGQPIGQRIATARRLKGWSQGELAKHLGVSQGQVSDWETGRVPQQVKHMRRVAKFLGEDPAQVVAEFRATRFRPDAALAELQAEVAELRRQLAELESRLPPPEVP